MASDQQVSAQHILQAVVRLKREGSQRVLEHLESVEGELASYFMEELSMIHQRILDLGAPARRGQLLLRRIEALTLVCIGALRESHYQLWREDQADGTLAQLDPTLNSPTPSPPSADGHTPSKP